MNMDKWAKIRKKKQTALRFIKRCFGMGPTYRHPLGLFDGIS